MKKLAILMVVTALAFAQEKGGPPPLGPGEVLRVVEIKHSDAFTISNSLGQIFPGIRSAGKNQIVVRGQPEVVGMIEVAIKKLDVPPPESQAAPNVELTVQLLLGSVQELKEIKLPPDLEPTVRQLRALFPYKSYKILDTEILLGSSNGKMLGASGTLPGGQSSFNFYTTPTVIQGTPRIIHLDRLTLELGMQYKLDSGQSGSGSAKINTQIDAREGQKTVVGKSNLIYSEDAIILVITPRVIE